MSKELTISEREELEMLRKQKSANNSGLRLAVSQKKALSLYGLQRFPITLYKEQWQRVIDYSDTIIEFIRDHEEELASKQ